MKEYPKDPHLPRLFYLASETYKKIWTKEYQDKAWAYMQTAPNEIPNHIFWKTGEERRRRRLYPTLFCAGATMRNRTAIRANCSAARRSTQSADRNCAMHSARNSFPDTKRDARDSNGAAIALSVTNWKFALKTFWSVLGILGIFSVAQASAQPAYTPRIGPAGVGAIIFGQTPAQAAATGMHFTATKPAAGSSCYYLRPQAHDGLSFMVEHGTLRRAEILRGGIVTADGFKIGDSISKIDPSVRYEVFLTPNGPTTGLYTAQRSSGGFIVRENPGGHSNTAFNYRIVAKALDQSSSPLQGTAKPHFAKPTNLTFSRRMLQNLRSARARYFHGPQLFQR